MLIALIAQDEQINKLASMSNSELDQVLSGISNMIGKCATAISTKKNLTRILVQLSDNDKATFPVCRIKAKTTLWHLVELLNALYHMSVNDAIKHDIYFKHQLCVHLHAIVFEGTEAESAYALKLLNQLCFDQRIAKHLVQEDAELFEKFSFDFFPI